MVQVHDLGFLIGTHSAPEPMLKRVQFGVEVSHVKHRQVGCWIGLVGSSIPLGVGLGVRVLPTLLVRAAKNQTENGPFGAENDPSVTGRSSERPR